MVWAETSEPEPYRTAQAVRTVSMEHPRISSFDIGAWLYQRTRSRHLVGRELGRQCLEVIEAQLRTTAWGAVTTLDCSGIEHLDFTAADECFARLIWRLQGRDYGGNMFLVFAGLTPTQEENVVIALERMRLAALVQRKDGPEIIGFLHAYLQEAFAFIQKTRTATAREWADATGEEITLGSTKMLSLHRARLVQRVSERIADGGRQFIYTLVEGHLAAPDAPTPTRRDYSPR